MARSVRQSRVRFDDNQKSRRSVLRSTSLKQTVVWAVLGASLAALVFMAAKRFSRDRPRGSAMAALEGHPWIAALYDCLGRCSEKGFVAELRRPIAGHATGRILDIGAGTGANFPYYREAGQVVALEPDPYMLQRARRRASELGLDIDFHIGRAEDLPFPDDSFDTVVATLVFCSVRDPARSLAEVKRVLRPGGTFRFIEHVRASSETQSKLQDWLTPLWRRANAGCHLNRQTAEAIEATGLEIVELERRPMPMTPMIAGIARPKAVDDEDAAGV